MVIDQLLPLRLGHRIIENPTSNFRRGARRVGFFLCQGEGRPGRDEVQGAEVEQGEEPPRYVATAAALDDTGRVVVYSALEHGVRSYDAASGRFSGELVAVPDPPDDDAQLELVLAAGRWALSDASEGLLWIEGLPAPVQTGRGADVRLQALTILATTGDPKLGELARERAVEDADPRVAAFASELMRTR